MAAVGRGDGEGLRERERDFGLFLNTVCNTPAAGEPGRKGDLGRSGLWSALSSVKSVSIKGDDVLGSSGLPSPKDSEKGVSGAGRFLRALRGLWGS